MPQTARSMRVRKRVWARNEKAALLSVTGGYTFASVGRLKRKSSRAGRAPGNCLAKSATYSEQLRRRNEGVERGALSRSGVGIVPERHVDTVCGNGPNRHTGFAGRRPATSPIPLTRHHTYFSDKLSRLAPSSELIERRSLLESGG